MYTLEIKLKNAYNPWSKKIGNGFQKSILVQDLTHETLENALHRLTDSCWDYIENNEKVLTLSLKGAFLNTRVHNALILMNIFTVGDLIQKTEIDLLRVSNFGYSSLGEVKRFLSNLGLTLKGSRNAEDHLYNT